MSKFMSNLRKCVRRRQEYAGTLQQNYIDFNHLYNYILEKKFS